MSGEEKTRWGVATAISLGLHLALFLSFRPAVVAPNETPPVMSVRLVMLSAPSGGGGGAQQERASQPAAQKAPARPSAEKTTVTHKAAPTVKRKTTPAAQTTTVQRTEVQAQPAPSVQSEETDILPSGAQQGGDAGTGGSAGTGSGTGGGEGSGVGAGRGSGTGDGEGIADLAGLEVLKKVSPEYPLISRKRREQGTAVVIARIENGSVTSAELEASSGHSRLDDSALKAASGWKFNYEGTIRVRIPFAFKING